MKKISKVVLVVTFLCILTPIFGQWEHHFIDPNTSYTTILSVDDMENDGDKDVVVAEYGTNKVLFYENNNLKWTKHIVDPYLSGVVGVDIADFDDDGKMDVVAAGWRASVVAWYKNEGGDTVNWTKNVIDNTLDGSNVVIAEDINGDGATDVVANGYTSGEVVWYENNLPMGWTTHIISANLNTPECMDVVDIDNDNKPDVVVAATGSGKVVLYKNNLPETNWIEIIIDENLPDVFSARIADIDNDGDMDIAASGQNATGGDADVAWYENDGSEQTWTKHSISTDMVKSRTLYIVDTDGDGDMDVIANDIKAGDVLLFKNEDDGQYWTKCIIDESIPEVNVVFAADVDGDNDFDILATTKVDNGVVWYENHSVGTAFAESLEVYPFVVQSLSDTLTVRTSLSNPENHPANVFAVIQSDQSQFIDSLQLFDDGLHSDGDSSDNVWGNIRLAAGLPEDVYEVDLITYDSTFSTSIGFHPSAEFITFGPVTFKYYSFQSPEDTGFYPGKNSYITITLKNNSTTATTANIQAHLISPNPLWIEPLGTRGFENMAPGESTTSDNIYLIKISNECPGDTLLPIIVNITYSDTICWRDTFLIDINSNPVSIKDIIAPETRIYPNPVNDMLTIETDYMDQHSIEITSLNGQLIYRKNMRGTSHHIDLSSVQKGVYFITIRSKDFVTTKKIIKL